VREAVQVGVFIDTRNHPLGNPIKQQLSFQEFALDYQGRFRAAVEGWDLAAIERIAGVLNDARARGATILIAGNGGSAAIASHSECDLSKGTHRGGTAPLRSRSLSANTSILTALGNDIGFDAVFEKQVEYFARPGDVLMVVSSSGNSPNVVRACRCARERGLVTVALVGFEGGELKRLADHVLHVPVKNYGIVEDLHQATIHLVTQYLTSLPPA
jgi:D-sedoheptulose 7-phosphate isomerase